MQIAVLFVQYERRECLVIYRRALEYLALSVGRHKKELVIRWEGDGCHGLSEVKVRQNDSFDHIDDQSEAIYVDTDQCAAIGGQDKPSDIASVLERQRSCNICSQVEHVYLIANWTQ